MLSLCVNQRGGERKSLAAHRVYLSLYPDPAGYNCDIAKVEQEGCVIYMYTTFKQDKQNAELREDVNLQNVLKD